MISTIEEFNLPPLVNLKPTHPYPPSLRRSYTPTVFSVNDNSDITLIEGIKYSVDGVKEIRCVPRTAEDMFEYILDAGTVFQAASEKFLPLWLKRMPEINLIDLFLPYYSKNYHYHGYILNAHSGALTIRKGKDRWGRVYSFFPAYPEHIANQLDENVPDQLDLNTFVPIFLWVLEACISNGFELNVLTSAASIAQSFLLREARGLFGHLDSMEPEVIEFARQCYKGHRFEAALCGLFNGYYYDLSFAYPSIIAKLVPCYSPYTEWKKDNKYHPEAFYGSARVIETPTHETPISPTMLRYNTYFGTRLMGPLCPQEKWLTKPELDLDIQEGLAKVEIIEAWWGFPKIYITPAYESIMHMYEGRNNPVIGRLIKRASQTICGKMGSTWEEYELEPISLEPLTYDEKVTTRTSPIFQFVYAAHVTGAIRAAITKLCINHDGSPRADGFLCQHPLQPNELSNRPGGLRLKSEGKQFVVDDIMYGLDFLELLRKEDPDVRHYYYPLYFVTTIKGANRGRKIHWARDIGRPGLYLQKRLIGSHKRMPEFEDFPTNKKLLEGLLNSHAPRDKNEVDFIQSQLADPLDF